MATKKEKEEKVSKKKAKTDQEVLALVEKLAAKLFSLMSSQAKIEVSEDKENDAIKLEIEAGDETGLLIGSRGDTLHSIQSLLGMMVRQETGEWKRIIVNIGDWREKQEDYLNGLATQSAQRAAETGQPQSLYNLTASQRRIVHLALSEIDNVETESVGEDEERCLVVKPAEKK